MIKDRPEHHQHERGGHEPESASVRGVLLSALVLIVLLAAVQPVVHLLRRSYGDATTGRLLSQTPPEMRSGETAHWEDPAADLEAVRRVERMRMERYEWIDRDEGLARVPVARAAEFLAEQRGGTGDWRNPDWIEK